MATSNDTRTTPTGRTIPMAWLDDVHALNSQLEAFQSMLYTWLRSELSESGDIRHEAVSRGMHSMLQTILDGYRDIETNMDDLNEAHRRISG